MAKTSAGLLMYRWRGDAPEVLLAHPGGPVWAKRDLGAWTIPKGEVAAGEDELAAARREFEEETGVRPDPAAAFHPLAAVRQKSGKTVHAWAFAGDCDPAKCHSNTFTMEWPPKSGKRQTFPEIDRAEFFPLAEARRRILPYQLSLLDELERSVPRH